MFPYCGCSHHNHIQVYQYWFLYIKYLICSQFTLIDPISSEIKEVEEEKRTGIKEIKKNKRKALGRLYAATLSKSFPRVEEILRQGVVTWADKITINGNTALHVAVGTTSTKDEQFLINMLNLATPYTLDMKNSDGSTLLHVAAIVGNTKAAELLVGINRDLLFAQDNDGQRPLARALSNMHFETSYYLLRKFYKVSDQDTETGNGNSLELLVTIFFDHFFLIISAGLASQSFCEKEYMPLTEIHNVLMAIAQNFPSKLNFWERMFEGSTCSFIILGYNFKLLSRFKFVEAIERKQKNYNDAKNLLKYMCRFIKSKTDASSHHEHYINAILEATRQNADEVVKIIVSELPNAIWSTNEHGHNIIQYAVITRSEKVYNLLYQMSGHKNIYKTIKDPFGNNLLHLAARLAPSDKLNHISGAALQIQSELKWFKEVQESAWSLNSIQKNSSGETPQMVFTKEHKELVIEGEKWMKETAQSYTITAALIMTIVFAAAITVPGGNNQDDGIPEFTNKTAFKVFAISDAISLFTSATSLLIFLSILTARFSEQDFLFKLPTKLMIGLTTLFISTTAMLVAFGATLYLMFCRNNPRMLVPVAALTCLPIACFLTLQFPLIKDLWTNTYGRSIFGKKSYLPF
ncbi:putative ankyrin repeat-containing domain, PGG domain, ankyrin repeat-containing domain superfamily [Helianthus anomalus]